ncbi:MAG: hypothetical protein WAM39_06150, partial [Bryobacteraceae bacterium]
MTTLTRDALLCERRYFIAIQSTGNMHWFARVAKDAIFRYRTREIGIRDFLISGCDAVSATLCVIANWRLEQVIAKLDEISHCVTSRSDNVGDSIPGSTLT